MDQSDWDALMDGLDEAANVDLNLEYHIVMLGTSGVGKTVFMTVMFQELLSAQRGLNIKTSIDFQNSIHTNYRRICRGEILPGSARHEEWRFVVKYGDTKLFNFKWIDYRGGTVRNVQRGDMAFAKIFDHLKESLAIFVIVDAVEYYHNPEEVHTQLAQFRKFLEVSLRNYRGIHLILILSKSDAVALRQVSRFVDWSWLKWWDKETMLKVCDEVFGHTFRDFAVNNENIKCDVIPISAYGKSARNGENGIVIKPGTHNLEWFQIDLPLRKAFGSILRAIDRQIPQAEKELRLLKSNNENHAWDLSGEVFVRKLSMLHLVSRRKRAELDQLKERRELHRHRIQLYESLLQDLKAKSKAARRIITEIPRDFIGFTYS